MLQKITEYLCSATDDQNVVLFGCVFVFNEINLIFCHNI